LLILSDSALPLGSFAFSSGLESYLAHTRGRSSFSSFLPESISSYASTTLPFVVAGHKKPLEVAELDDALDAAIMCTVGRRASIAQGRALLSIWDRSFKASLPKETADALKPFAAALVRSASFSSASMSDARDLPRVSAHLAPLFGAIANLVGLTLQQTAYIFMLGHVKALISAAVRASVFGPYQAQKLLASVELQAMINAAIEREWDTPVEEAGQTVPMMDLWIGRHEMLYSRIFNS
jgi:urease accessory protein